MLGRPQLLGTLLPLTPGDAIHGLAPRQKNHGEGTAIEFSGHLENRLQRLFPIGVEKGLAILSGRPKRAPFLDDERP